MTTGTLSEEWRPVVGYDGFYEVSDRGQVRSVARVVPSSNGRQLHYRTRQIKQHPDSNGYPQVVLCRNGTRKTGRVHRLMMEAFHGPAPGMDACHNDGVRTHNVLSNLRYGTRSENVRDTIKHGKHNWLRSHPNVQRIYLRNTLTTVTAAPEYPEFASDVNVELIDHMGDEGSIVRAARVSTLGSKATADESKGLLAYLYNNKHASPFEHCVLTFRIEAPIFVTREILRHRLSSFNEESGRYRELAGRFYTPDMGRPLVQVGKVGNYEFVPGTIMQQRDVEASIEESCRVAWKEYQYMLQQGIAREVARMVLPVNTYSTIYYTANLRSILNFLSLRVDWGEDAAIQSKPQYEIELVALQIAHHVQRLYPVVFDLFRQSGFQAV